MKTHFKMSSQFDINKEIQNMERYSICTEQTKSKLTDKIPLVHCQLRRMFLIICYSPMLMVKHCILIYRCYFDTYHLHTVCIVSTNNNILMATAHIYRRNTTHPFLTISVRQQQAVEKLLRNSKNTALKSIFMTFVFFFLFLTL